MSPITLSVGVGMRSPIGHYKREGVTEPRLVSYVPKKLKPEDRAWNFPKGLDVYDLVLDGHSYSSQHLLQQTKHKKVIKPNGPTDLYRVPILSSMDVGWHLNDSALQGQDWMEVRKKYPWPWSEMTRFLDHIRRVDKFCNM
ncbi:uncharacterized protein LOC113218432 [Frankliniella occidentalis]|uniref:Uncharacterized protein LOC113218432 n=1 Tax=Frankliniella occidentalis TaxID=133901 RepID=A0A9C6WXK4_FRAOC|nr:uncharacterized protein LOC113218432 [Frankliniella occidentalis]